MTDLSSRVVIITGAAGGIGRELVKGVLEAGARVLATDVDRPALEALHEHCNGHSGAGSLVAMGLDLCHADAGEDLVASARAHFGRVDAVVNNAGIGRNSIAPDAYVRPPKAWEIDPGTWQRFFAVNSTAVFSLTRAAIPGMLDAGWGRIVTVTTSLESMLRPGLSPYGPSKAAAEAFTAIVATELAGTGVTANVLVPGGPTDTPMVSANSGFDRDALLRPDVMVAPLLWLLSDAADSINGRRFRACHWDATVPPERAAAVAGVPIAWTPLATDRWVRGDSRG